MMKTVFLLTFRPEKKEDFYMDYEKVVSEKLDLLEEMVIDLLDVLSKKTDVSTEQLKIAFANRLLESIPDDWDMGEDKEGGSDAYSEIG